MGGSWRFRPCQGYTAGHNSLCGDCVEGPGPILKPSLYGLVGVGAVAFAFGAFPPSCGLLDVSVLRVKVNLKEKTSKGKHHRGAVHV